VRLGFVGIGAIASHHLGVLGLHPDVEVSAVCDADAGRAQEVAARIGARAHTDWERLLDRERLDAVVICTPPMAHAAPAIAALQRGIPVYLEKPLARAIGDGEAIVAAWRRTGTICAVGYQWRSLDILDRARTELAGAVPGMLISRSIGPTEPGRGDARRMSADGSWFIDPSLSGGILFELGSHDIDLQVALAGRAASVHAVSASGLLALAGTSAPSGLDDAVGVIVRYAAGAIGAILVAWTDAQDPPVYSLDLMAVDVALQLDLDPGFRLRGRSHGGRVDVTAAADPRVSTISRFLDAVRTGRQDGVPCSPGDALDTLHVALAAEEAIATGQPVAVSQPAL
jgi:predicted dehydrogenase